MILLRLNLLEARAGKRAANFKKEGNQMQNRLLLQIKNISKYFPGVKALNNVSFDAYTREVLGLVGVNGAGKSTLLNILGGIIKPDEGEVIIEGHKVEIRNPRIAKDLGIAFIQQEIQVFDDLKVFENILISDLYKWRSTKALPFLNINKLRTESKKYLDMLGCNIDVNTRAASLSIGEKQMVQISRALSQGGNILLFDEPTSSLATKEKQSLFEIIKKLRASNLVIIYITHYLDEIFEICDKVIVLRDGQVTGKENVNDINKKNLINYMVGHDIKKMAGYKSMQTGKKILEVTNITGEKLPKDVSFSLRKGEILGVWGLMGSGRTELFRTLLGFDKMRKGQIRYRENGNLKQKKSKQFFKNTGYVTEERHFSGLFLQMPLWKNMSSVCLKKFASRYLRILRSKKEKNAAREYINKVNISAVNEDMLAYQLSGGNQQKVVLAKWFMKKPEVLFMDEPTKGVDVSAKAEIQKLIFEMAKSGISFVIVSSELEEIMYLCDRIIVLYDGKSVSEVSKEDFSKDKLMSDITGGES